MTACKALGPLKECNKCFEWKPRESFSPGVKLADGLKSTCKVCRRTEYREWDLLRDPEIKKIKTKISNERASSRRLEWQAANPERVKASKDRYRKNNPDAVRRWALSSPETMERFKRLNVDREHRRRARKLQLFVEKVDSQLVFERDQWICRHPECLKPVDPDMPRNSKWGATVDHIVPLSKGGEHSYANVQLMHKSCNCKKAGNILEISNE